MSRPKKLYATSHMASSIIPPASSTSATAATTAISKSSTDLASHPQVGVQQPTLIKPSLGEAKIGGLQKFIWRSQAARRQPDREAKKSVSHPENRARPHSRQPALRHAKIGQQPQRFAR